MSPLVGFKKKAIDEAGHPIGLLAGDGIEVAVVALVKAKGNVDIQRGDYRGREVGGLEGRR